MKKHHAYIVKWRDSCALRGWDALNGAQHTVSTITSVGWLARSTPREVTITTSLSDHGSMLDALTIPKEAITKMTRLKNYIAGE